MQIYKWVFNLFCNGLPLLEKYSFKTIQRDESMYLPYFITKIAQPSTTEAANDYPFAEQKTLFSTEHHIHHYLTETDERQNGRVRRASITKISG